MATKLFLRNTTNNGISNYYDMVDTAGSASATCVVNTAASGTEIQFTQTAGGATAAWISGRAPAGGFTLTTTDISAWLNESHMLANCGGRYRVFIRTAAGVETEIGGGPFDDGVEFGTSATEMLWTGNVTDQAFSEDDRILLKLYITNIGTMAGTYTCTLTFNAADAATGDSFFNIAETVAFKAEEQALTPSLFTNSNTFYSPTVAATYALTPSLYTDADTFYAATVATTYALTPSLYSDADTFYSPTVVQPTRLYFHDAASTVSGTLPSGEQSARTQDWVTTGGATNRTMNTIIGTGQTSRAGSSTAVVAGQNGLLGMFISPPLSGAQTVGGGTMIVNTAEAEDHLDANFRVNALTVYVWRPSTGAQVGSFVRDGGSTGGTEPTSINSEQVTHATGVTTTAVSAADGDVVVCEIWAVHAQATATARTCTFYFDGTTVNTTENAVVSNHASFIEFAEALVFAPDTQALTPSLFSNANTFYTQVVASTYSVTPSLYTDADIFYTQTVSATYALTPALFVDADAIPAHAVSATYALTPALFVDGDTFYTPAVSATYPLSPSLYSDGDTFYSQTVSSTYGLTPALYADADTFYSHVVAQGDQALQPSLYDDADTFYSATVAASYALVPSLYVDVDTFYGPTIGATYGLSPSLHDDADTFYAHVVFSNYELLPSPVNNVTEFYIPGVTQGRGHTVTIPTARPTYVGKDWTEVVREADPDPKVYVRYRFSNGREFK